MGAQDLLLRSLHELENRRVEGWRVYTPQPHQELALTSRARRLLIFGGNQSGKTLNAAVRTSDLLLGNRGWDQVRSLLCVSLDLTLMSSNIYEKLFEPGAFDICKNCHQVRHVCEDAGLCDQDGSSFHDRAIPANPLIPQRLLDRRKARDGFAWYDRARNQPALCWIKGASGRPPITVTFRSTDQGRSKFQGPQWDHVWADEEASNDSSVMFEIERGLIKRKGGFHISATPLAASITIFRWHEKALAEADTNRYLIEQGKQPNPLFYEEVRLPTASNRALDSDDIDRFSEEMSADERAVRLEGEFVILQGLVYGKEFRKEHICEPFDIPPNWTIYTIEDPGTANAYAVLFVAVDPDGDYWLFDEIYMPRSNIPDLVKAKCEALSIRGRWTGRLARRPQKMYADPAINAPHQGKKRTATLKQLLIEEHRRKNLRAWEGGFNVYNAKNEVRAGIFAVKGLLEKRNSDGEPVFHVFKTLHHFHREIGLYRWPPPDERRDPVEHRGPIKKNDHLMDTMRYAVMARLRYIDPGSRDSRKIPLGLEEAWKRKLRKRRRRAAERRHERMSLN